MIAKMAGRVDAGDDGLGLVIGRRGIAIAVGIFRFAGFAVDEQDFRHFVVVGWFRIGLFGRDGLGVGFPMMFERAVFALEFAFGGGDVAQEKVVVFESLGIPGVHGRLAIVFEEVVVFFLGAQAEPFGLGGFDDEGVEDGVFSGALVFVEPAGEQVVPVCFVFAGDEEGGGAQAMAGGVSGGGGFAEGRGRTRAAGVAFCLGMIGGGIEEILLFGHRCF